MLRKGSMRRAANPRIRPSALATSGIWALCAALGAVSCADDTSSPYFGTTDRTGKDPTTFYLNNGTEPEYLDPGKSTDAASSALILQLFEGLTAYHPEDLRPTPGVAVRWDESEDKRRLRFYLRPNAKWSDGAPVTAHDFEYAWKRVLLPRTASRAAPNLYPLKNGEIFNRGKLKVAAADLRLRTEPREGSAPAATLPRGAAVLVLASTPMALASSIRPLPRVPEGISSVFYTKSPESLAFGAERIAPDSQRNVIKVEKGAEVTVLGRVASVECNGAPDHWFSVELSGERGVLPGCMLAEPKSSKQFLLVERFADLPSFGERRNVAPVDPAPSGFVLEREILSDVGVVGVRAKDDLTLDVELEQPTPYFTDLTSHPTLYPVRRDLLEEFERRGQADLWFRPENMISNGPYILDQWKFRYEITMKRSPHYWDREKLRIHRIVWLEVDDYRSTMNLYKAGEIDFLGDNVSLPSEYMDLLSAKRDFLRFPILSTYWFDFNTRKTPTDDVRVRWALNLAIDKREIVERITRAGQIPATHIVPDFTGRGYAEQAAADRAAGADPFASPDFLHNPERGRALLAEAGYPVVTDGEGYRASGFPPIEILYNTNEGHRHIAIAVQSMWKRHLGVSATLRNEEWKVMLKSVRDGQFQVARGGMGANYNHPQTFLDMFLSYSPQNATGWADKDFDALIKAALAAPDRKESIKLYRKAEERAVAGMSRLPLYFYTKSTLIKPWVKGYYGTVRMVHLVKWLWIDEGWRERPENRPAFRPPELPEPGRLVDP
jgi:oligopeptide transport system substrate-binding protein